MDQQPAETITYKGIDISFVPNEHAKMVASEYETSTRRNVRVDLAWKDLSFTVPVNVKKPKSPPKNLEDADDHPASESSESFKPHNLSPQQTDAHHRQILNNISGFVNSGQMLAVMGSSGAGKTSLLNLLAGRITTSKGAHASGSVYVNGRPRNYAQFTKLAAYVLQDDDMFAELTVEEQLTYAALLRLPASMPREKKLLRVQKVIQELGLAKVKDTMVGNQIVRGISGGERKRVNIGSELVTDPALLFLDEPTTGLDSFNALNVMSTLRQLATNGRTIVSTIHQPRSSIFAMFDQLCLLSEGRVMYFGPAKDAVSYFAALNFRSPKQFNPADFFLDLLSVDPRSAEREKDTQARVEYLGDKYAAQETPLMIDASPDVENAGEDDHGHDGDSHRLADKQFQTSWINEFLTLCGRAVKLACRERAANTARFGQVFIFSLLLGLIWLSNGRSDDLMSRASLAGILFFIVINQAFGGVFAVIFGYPLERSIVTRERASNMYRTSSYYLSKTITDVPKTLLFNLGFALIVYWMVGLRASAGAFFTFVLLIFGTSFLAESLAIAVSVVTGDAQTAAGIIPVFIILGVLLGGFFIGSSELPGWLSWAQYASFVFYAFNALVKNQFEGVEGSGWEQIQDNFNGLSLWENFAALVGILLLFRLMGYLFLHYLRGPKFLKF